MDDLGGFPFSPYFWKATHMLIPFSGIPPLFSGAQPTRFLRPFEVNPFRSLEKLYDDATLRIFAQLPDRAAKGKTQNGSNLRALDPQLDFCGACAVVSDEHPWAMDGHFKLLNDEQMSNKVGV